MILKERRVSNTRISKYRIRIYIIEEIILRTNDECFRRSKIPILDN